jgi:hypothetical protein
VKVTFISLDHDLAPEHYELLNYQWVSVENWKPERGKAVSFSPTGYDVACWIEEAVLEKKIKMPRFSIHSMNPVGAGRIRAALSRWADMEDPVRGWYSSA